MNKKFWLFTIKLALIIGGAVGAYWLLFWFLWLSPLCPNAYDRSYQHALLLQYDALADESRENELIVFGASYVPFGIDKDTLSSVTGMPVQTLGVEADMGTRELIDILRNTVKPGDTVCYVLGKSNDYYEDYTVISCALESDKEKLKNYFASRPESQKYYRDTMMWRKIYSLVAGNLVEKVRSGFSNKEQVYSLDSFDEKGNMTVLREGTIFDTDNLEEETLTFDEVDTLTMDVMNNLIKWCQKNDIDFVICYGMLIDETVTQSQDVTDKYHQDVQAYMKAPVIMKPEQVFMDKTYFYNHVYHLNTEGARIYSGIIGEAINAYKASED